MFKISDEVWCNFGPHRGVHRITGIHGTTGYYTNKLPGTWLDTRFFELLGKETKPMKCPAIVTTPSIKFATILKSPQIVVEGSSKNGLVITFGDQGHTVTMILKGEDLRNLASQFVELADVLEQQDNGEAQTNSK